MRVYPRTAYFIPAHVGNGVGVGWDWLGLTVLGGGGGVQKITRQKTVFSEWVRLVGKMILDLVGVFCGHLGPPCGHIAQKSKFYRFSWILGTLAPIGPLRALC